MHGAHKISPSTLMDTTGTFLFSSSPTSVSRAGTPHLRCSHNNALIAHLDSGACSAREVRQIHGHLLRTSALPSPTSFLWNCLMRAYLRRSSASISLQLYSLMSRHGPLPDSHSLPIALKAASLLGLPALAPQLHSLALKLALHSHAFCETALLSLYSKSGDLPAARDLFDENPHRTLASWNALMSGLAHAGRPRQAIFFFADLLRVGGRPDGVTVVTALSACASLGDLRVGRRLHKHVLGLPRGVLPLWNSLVDMYGKCGRADLARRVFDGMPERDVSSWTAMITASAAGGHVADALACFREMRRHGVAPNRVTFVSVLSACAHGGLVEEGVGLFGMMRGEFGVEPGVAHYGCVLDLLGRAGRLEDARGMVEGMGAAANREVLGAVIGACEKHGDVGVGTWAAGRLMELEPWNDGVYVVLSNIFARAGMWEEVERVRGLMRQRKVSKMRAFSFPATS